MPKQIITLADIEKIGELASLELSQQEKQEMVKQFEGILGYFKMIDQAALPDLGENSTDMADALREDQVVESGVSPESFSDHLEDGHFKVPKVIER